MSTTTLRPKDSFQSKIDRFNQLKISNKDNPEILAKLNAEAKNALKQFMY
jgi:phosphopantothenoylcysteine synthetase/decarboxylase